MEKSVHEAVEAFLDHRRARRRSLRTIEQYRYLLEDLWLTWYCREDHHHPSELCAVTVEQFVAFFEYLANEHPNRRTHKPGLAPETINCAWRALRALWNFAGRRKWITEEQKDYFKDDEYIPRPAVDQRLRPALEDSVLQALLDACITFNDSEERTRNRALVLLLAESGARISEIASMTDEQTRIEERCGAIIGKGNRQEWIFWHNRANRALQTYLRVRGGKPGGAVFRRLGGCEGMGSDDIRRMLKMLARIAGVELPVGAPAHSFRHRFAHKAIDAGLDISQVAQLMRHRDHDTTYRYLRENRERLRGIRDKMDKEEGEEK